MDWDLYKALCDRPDVVSRWLLEQTLELLDDADLASRLTVALNGTPLPRPPDHRGARELDMLQPALTLADVEALHDAVRAAVAAGRSTSGTRTRGLGGFVEAWGEYRRWLHAQTAAERLPCSARS